MTAARKLVATARRDQLVKAKQALEQAYRLLDSSEPQRPEEKGLRRGKVLEAYVIQRGAHIVRLRRIEALIVDVADAIETEPS